MVLYRIVLGEIFSHLPLMFFTGINDSKTINLGLSIEYRSNTINGMDALSVFEFKNNPAQFSRSGITSFAPSIKFSPIKQVSNFTIQSAFHIPTIDQEEISSVFLDQKGFIWQNKFFYDYVSNNEFFQIFTEVNTLYSFGKKNPVMQTILLGLLRVFLLVVSLIKTLQFLGSFSTIT